MHAFGIKPIVLIFILVIGFIGWFGYKAITGLRLDVAVTYAFLIPIFLIGDPKWCWQQVQPWISSRSPSPFLMGT